MKKQILCFIFDVGCTYVSHGQVGIGTKSPSVSSQLEVVAIDKGILIPRISLKGTADAVTINQRQKF